MTEVLSIWLLKHEPELPSCFPSFIGQTGTNVCVHVKIFPACLVIGLQVFGNG